MIWLNLRHAPLAEGLMKSLTWAALAGLAGIVIASLLSSQRKNIMKMIERLKAFWSFISDALADMVADDIPMKGWPKLTGPIPTMPPCKVMAEPVDGPGYLVALDLSHLKALDPLERKEAHDTIKWLLWRTRAGLGPGEWLQVIRRRKVDGQFSADNPEIKDLFNEDHEKRD